MTLAAGITPGEVAVDQFRNLIYVGNGNVSCITTIYGKTNQSVTNGNIGNGCNDIAVDVLTNRVYVTKATQAASELAVFRGVLVDDATIGAGSVGRTGPVSWTLRRGRIGMRLQG